MDWAALGAQAILGLVPVITMVIVYYARKAVPKLPRFSIPIIAMALGFVLTMVQGMLGGENVAPLVGVLLGASATWLRELINTINEHGNKP
jgi:hypothetical protein